MTESQQTFHALSPEDKQWLEDQREVVREFVRDEPRLVALLSAVTGRLGVLNILLQSGHFGADRTEALRCFGVVLGDAFVDFLDLKWVIVEDEHGCEAAVRVPGTRTVLFPLRMISERIEAGEEVDAIVLFVRSAAGLPGFVDAARRHFPSRGGPDAGAGAAPSP